MDKLDKKLFCLHCENMIILKLLGADDKIIEQFDSIWKEDEADKIAKEEDNH